MITTAVLQQLRPLLNLAELARRAGIPEQTLFAKVRRGTGLSAREATSLARVLNEAGLRVDLVPETARQETDFEARVASGGR